MRGAGVQLSMGETASFQAGAAEVDITPKAGIHLAGDVGRWRPAKLALDPLFARALVLESGGKRLCLVVLDLTIVTEEYTGLIREEAALRFGLEPSAVMVHATQTHTAPSLGHFMFDESFRRMRHGCGGATPVTLTSRWKEPLKPFGSPPFVLNPFGWAPAAGWRGG